MGLTVRGRSCFGGGLSIGVMGCPRQALPRQLINEQNGGVKRAGWGNDVVMSGWRAREVFQSPGT